MKTAAAYVRVSDIRQDEFSPDSQLKLIRDYCARNDIVLPDELIFYDDGISAKTAKKRKQFNDMIALAKQKDKPFEIILVWKFSRFARNQEESIVYKSLLKKNGVEVISVSEPIADNPFGGLIERIIEWMDEFYLVRLSDEVRRGMTERATRGLPNCAPPFGYNMVDGLYVINEEEAAIVRQIFEMYKSGVPSMNIAVTLTSQGVVNRLGNPIDNRGIEYMVNNPCYKGALRWSPKGRSASARIYNNPNDIVIENTHEAIIDKVTWQLVQERVEYKKRTYVKHSHENAQCHEHMLRGLVKCSTCGSTLVYSKSNNGFQCHKYAKGSCLVSHYISAIKLSNMVIARLKEDTESMNFEIVNAPKLTVESTIDYDKLIAAERLKLDRAKQAYQVGIDSLEEYRQSKLRIDKQIEAYKTEKKKSGLRYSGISTKKYAQTVSEAVKLLENPNTPEELKNKTLKTIVQKIVFYRPDERIEIFYQA